MLKTNSPVSWTLRTLSLRSAPTGWAEAANMMYGGSQPTMLNWLNGARFAEPLRPSVEIHAIGRGTTQLLNGLNGKPWLFLSVS